MCLEWLFTSALCSFRLDGTLFIPSRHSNYLYAIHGRAIELHVRISNWVKEQSRLRTLEQSLFLSSLASGHDHPLSWKAFGVLVLPRVALALKRSGETTARGMWACSRTVVMWWVVELAHSLPRRYPSGQLIRHTLAYRR